MLVDCIICLNGLQSSEVISHTECGHVFHDSCLIPWVKKAGTCPNCREKVAANKIGRLYLHSASNDPAVDDGITIFLQTQISDLKHKLLIKEREIIESNSENSKLSALLKSKDTEISGLQTSIQIAQKENKEQKNHMEIQRREIESMNRNVAHVTRQKDFLLWGFKRFTNEVSQMFHGITNETNHSEIISIMKRELETCTNSRLELQRTVMNLQQELTEVSDVRMLLASERTKRWEMESNLACLEIDKVHLRRRIEELEDMVKPGVEPHYFVRDKTPERIPVAMKNSVPFKKQKIDTTDKLSGIAGGSATAIDVIGLTVQPVEPLIDLTYYTVESPRTPTSSPQKKCVPMADKQSPDWHV